MELMMRIGFLGNNHLPASFGSLKSCVLFLLGFNFTFASCSANELLIFSFCRSENTSYLIDSDYRVYISHVYTKNNEKFI